MLKENLDPRVKRTRKLLLDAHNTLIEEIGISKLSIQKITERATINRATFYAHFSNLEDLTRYAVSQTYLASLEETLLDAAPIAAARFCQLGVATHQYMQFFETDTRCPSGNSVTRADTKSAKHGDLLLRIEKHIEQELYSILLSWLVVTPVKANSRFIEPKLQALAMSAALCSLASRKVRDVPELTFDDAVMHLWLLFQC